MNEFSTMSFPNDTGRPLGRAFGSGWQTIMELEPLVDPDGVAKTRHPLVLWRSGGGKVTEWQMKCKRVLFQRHGETFKFRFHVVGEETHDDTEVPGVILSRNLLLTSRKKWDTSIKKLNGANSSCRMISIGFGFTDHEVTENDIFRIEVLVPLNAVIDNGETFKLAVDWGKTVVDANLAHQAFANAMNIDP